MTEPTPVPETLRIGDILKQLPHRYPFLLVDRVLECVPGSHIRALKNVTMNEPFFVGHFPELPVMPGVLVLEAMAQVGAILAARTFEPPPAAGRRVYYFTGVDEARFRRPVEPGDQLLMTVKLQRRIKTMYRCTAEARVDGQPCCTAELMFTYRDL
jgi:3-hydroxyacyl-[acyl-carrier-protein] dehydratase